MAEGSSAGLRPVVLGANRPADRFYRGGPRLAELRGEAAASDHEPEDWIASSTHLFGVPGVGETVLPDGRTLTEAIAADPAGWLGEPAAAGWGADARLLVKLLDAGERLPVHAHPDDGFAAAHVGAAHGKAEAWVILQGGAVHLGLRRDIGAAELRTLVDDQRTDELLGLLHRVEVTPGDAVFVPAGTLHAIGEGVLLLEVQQPEDLSILLEWRGFALDGERDGHLGLGFDVALAAVDRRELNEVALGALVRRGDRIGSLLPPAADPYFSVERLVVDGTARLPAGYSVVLVERGEVAIGGEPLRRGGTLLVPAAAGPLPVTGSGVLLISRPPSPVQR